MDCDCYLDETAAVGALTGARELGILGEGVEAGHQGVKNGEEVGEGGLQGGKCIKELGNCDVWACAEVAEGGLTLSRGEVEEYFLFVGGFSAFGEEADEGFGGGVALNVGAPGQELTARCG